IRPAQAPARRRSRGIMGPLDAFWHLINFLAPALGAGLLATFGAKLWWRRELAGTRWQRLALWSCTAGALTLLAGLLLLGRDGAMATYAAMTLACALALLWSGFIRPRR